jgi:hypothetical protein
MGIAVAATLSALLCMFGMLTRRVNILYTLMFIIIFFAEYGTDFKSDNGSIFFNQQFMSFYNFKLIEIIIGASYLFILLTRSSSNKKGPLEFEKTLAILFFLVIFIVSLVEYWKHNYFFVGTWRLLVSGMMLVHMMSMLINTRDEFLRFTRLLLLMMTARATIGLIMFALGYGEHTFRGMAPFFWDDRLIEGFAFCAILITSYLTGYSVIQLSDRILSKSTAGFALAIMLITVALCYRRTIWLVCIGGIVMILLYSNMIKIRHLLGIVLACILSIILIATMPGMGKIRSKVVYYANSMNIFSNVSTRAETQAEASTATHIYNVQQYFHAIANEPVILFAGLSGRDGPNYMEVIGTNKREGPLGTPHNSVLATTIFFGSGGTIIYLLLYLSPILSYRRIKIIRDDSVLKYTALAAWALLFCELIPAISFAPAFYTSLKGSFFTLTTIYIFRSSLYYSKNNTEAVSEQNEPVSKPTPMILRKARPRRYI